MNAIEAYKASHTCVCGGIPHLNQGNIEFQIQCMSCGTAGPICETAEQAVNHWNLCVEAMTSKQSVIDLLCRNNPKMAEVLGKASAHDPGPVIEAARGVLDVIGFVTCVPGVPDDLAVHKSARAEAAQAVKKLRQAVAAYDAK